MTKSKLIKRIETIQGKVQELWLHIGTDYGLHCQTVMRELAVLQKKLESGEVKGK